MHRWKKNNRGVFSRRGARDRSPKFSIGLQCTCNTNFGKCSRALSLMKTLQVQVLMNYARLVVELLRTTNNIYCLATKIRILYTNYSIYYMINL